MTYDELVDALLQGLLDEGGLKRGAAVPEDTAGRRSMIRALMNTRPPGPVDPQLLQLQDELLSLERAAKAVTDPVALPSVAESCPSFRPLYSRRLVLWKGDITTLAADAIVNAANAQLLGCFFPLHNCIDNVIHSAAGMQLRNECSRIMQEQGHDEPTGQAKITPAYNLPCKYVLHTVGPIIKDAVSGEDVRLLESCYTACLDLAAQTPGVRSVAFPCISTGVFRFPKDTAALIALTTVGPWLEAHPDRIERVIFNVFTGEDYDEYYRYFSHPYPSGSDYQGCPYCARRRRSGTLGRGRPAL